MSAPNESQREPDLAAASRLFLEARTFSGWLDTPVEEATLRELFRLARMGPTAANSQPGRFLFLTSLAAKERLKPALSPTNVDKTMAAPVTVVVAFDNQFHEQMSKVFPARPELEGVLGKLADPARSAYLLQNASLQAGYLIMAARSLGLDCGPMGGFDKDKVDREFFADSPWRATLLINIGYGDPKSLFPRNPRLSFEDACRIL